jgi:putative NADH-flavin reductase
VIGGSGGIGRLTVAQAHAGGDDVKTLVRSRARLGNVAPAVGVIEGDALDADALDATLAGADAVLSALGPSGPGTTSVYSHGAASVLAAMQRTGVRRLICVSAAGLEQEPASTVLSGLIIPLMWGRRYADMRAMEEILARSHVEWTVVRPVRLTNGPRTGSYREADRILPGASGSHIARADVADFMLRVAAGGLYVRERPAIAY